MNALIFSEILVQWWVQNKRSFPWKQTRDPYRIWISEVILQQTRVVQGEPYYIKFITTFPDIYALAAAEEDQVLKTWEGLGYYSRARNIHYTARQIVAHNEGKFPDTYEAILKLKGVGNYTAAAISSFAFDLPHAVVDGNVTRLVSRLLGITNPVEESSSKKAIQIFVSDAIKYVDPASFNQALLDFGSLVCTVLSPSCGDCALKVYCKAWHTDQVKSIPLKSKKIIKKSRYFHFLDIADITNENIIIFQRDKKDIWKGLYELPMIESESEMMPDLSVFRSVYKTLNFQDEAELTNCHKLYETTQLLTHRKIYGYFYKIILSNTLVKINKPYYLVERKKVSNFAFPKIVSDYFTIFM